MQTIHNDDDVETQRRLEKAKKKYEPILNYYLEDELDTVELMNNWLLYNSSK